MHTFLGISVDAGASIDGDCDMTHTVTPNCVEIEFGHSTGCLHLGLTEAATTKLVNVATVALDEMRQLHATAHHQDRSRGSV